MATTMVSSEELDRRIDGHLRLRGLRLYRGISGDREIINRFSREVVQRDVSYAALVLACGALKPDEELIISDPPPPLANRS